MEFKEFGAAIAKQFQIIQAAGLFRTATVMIVAFIGVGCATRERDDTAVPAKAQTEVIVAAAASPPSSEPCDSKSASASVLNKLHPVLSLEYSESPTVEMVRRKQFRAKCIREWVDGGGVADPCVRQNYIEWLDYFDGSYLKKLEAAASAPTPAESDAQRYDRERREEEGRLRKWESAHNVPRPPEACERSVIQAAK